MKNDSNIGLLIPIIILSVVFLIVIDKSRRNQIIRTSLSAFYSAETLMFSGDKFLCGIAEEKIKRAIEPIDNKAERWIGRQQKLSEPEFENKVDEHSVKTRWIGNKRTNTYATAFDCLYKIAETVIAESKHPDPILSSTVKHAWIKPSPMSRNYAVAKVQYVTQANSFLLKNCPPSAQCIEDVANALKEEFDRDRIGTFLNVLALSGDKGFLKIFELFVNNIDDKSILSDQGNKRRLFEGINSILYSLQTNPQFLQFDVKTNLLNHYQSFSEIKKAYVNNHPTLKSALEPDKLKVVENSDTAFKKEENTDFCLSYWLTHHRVKLFKASEFPMRKSKVIQSNGENIVTEVFEIEKISRVHTPDIICNLKITKLIDLETPKRTLRISRNISYESVVITKESKLVLEVGNASLREVDSDLEVFREDDGRLIQKDAVTGFFGADRLDKMAKSAKIVHCPQIKMWGTDCPEIKPETLDKDLSPFVPTDCDDYISRKLPPPEVKNSWLSIQRKNLNGDVASKIKCGNSKVISREYSAQNKTGTYVERIDCTNAAIYLKTKGKNSALDQSIFDLNTCNLSNKNK